MGNLLGMLMKLIGGFPLQIARQVFAEYLPVTKSLNGGMMTGLLGNVLSNGLGSVFQNPIEGIAGQFEAIATNALSNLSGDVLGQIAPEILGSSGLLTAVGDLSGLAGQLSGAVGTDLLSGQFGLLDVITHGTILKDLGSAAPAALAFEKVIGPLNAGGLLSAVAGQLTPLMQGLGSGDISVSDGIDAIATMRNTIAQVTVDATTALTMAREGSATLGMVNAAAAAFISAPDDVRAALQTVIKPEAQDAIQAALDAMAAENSEGLEDDEDDDV